MFRLILIYFHSYQRAPISLSQKRNSSWRSCPELLCAGPGDAVAHCVWRLAPLHRMLCTSPDHRGFTWQIKGKNTEGQSAPNPFPSTLSHPKKHYNPPSSWKMCFCGARCEKEGTIAVPLRCAAGPVTLGGQEGRINLSKVQRLQGSSLVGRLYKYLLNKTLPVNWWQSKVWFSFPPPETAGKAGLTN